MGVTLVAWNRYGHRRTYVNDDDGASLGYRDEQTGEVHVTVAVRADDVRAAFAEPPPEPATTAPGADSGPEPDPERLRQRRAARAAGRARRAWQVPVLSEKALADELRLSSPFVFEREVGFNAGAYRLDFYCAVARLAVEVDGPSHRGRAEHDAERDRYFRAQGIETVRFTRAEVERDCGAVVARINRRCVERTGSAAPPRDVPSGGLLTRLFGRTKTVEPRPLAPARFDGTRRGDAFVCAGCRQEREPAFRSMTTVSRCTGCVA